MRLDKILVPTDFSSASDAALANAVDLAEYAGHKIVLLHVFTPPIFPLLDGAVIPTAAHLTDLVTESDRQLTALCERFDRRGVGIDGKTVQGTAAEEILAFAEREGCDLIVMGTHGRSGMRRLMLGSVADTVVRAARIPVLTIREDLRAAAAQTLAQPAYI